MHAAGVDGDLVYFVLEDHHVTESNFYALIDSLLASGEVQTGSQDDLWNFILSLNLIRFQGCTLVKKSRLFWRR
jgi:hypothetical protein